MGNLMFAAQPGDHLIHSKVRRAGQMCHLLSHCHVTTKFGNGADTIGLVTKSAYHLHQRLIIRGLLCLFLECGFGLVQRGCYLCASRLPHLVAVFLNEVV